MNNIVIFGATSAIAEATAKIFAKEKANFILVARDIKKLEAVSKNLSTLGANSVSTIECDLEDISRHKEIFSKIDQTMPKINILLIAYGVLPDQSVCQSNFPATLEAFNTNFISACSILTDYANYFEQNKSGTIAVITSVAGDRGRQSNYIYGAAKGALSIFLQGLRNRLSKANVNVIDIKPGFISTPMTAHLKKGLLFVSAETAGREIANAIKNNKNIAYVPKFWKLIMIIIKLIPERIFSKMKL